MQCAFCQKELPSPDRFCGSCGHPIGISPQARMPITVALPQQRGGYGGVIAIVMMIVLFLGGSAVLLFGGVALVGLVLISEYSLDAPAVTVSASGAYGTPVSWNATPEAPASCTSSTCVMPIQVRTGPVDAAAVPLAPPSYSAAPAAPALYPSPQPSPWDNTPIPAPLPLTIPAEGRTVTPAAEVSPPPTKVDSAPRVPAPAEIEAQEEPASDDGASQKPVLPERN